jgi:peptidoglycan/LPS O-acetylase OafA/YrhL
LNPSSPARLPGLDTLRAIAIVAVMLFHLGWLLPKSFAPVSRFGWMGVDLFFVLSGYLIGSQLLKPYLAGETPSIAGFYRRRIYRILPAYLFVLSLYFTLPVWREEDGISPLWQFLTFTETCSSTIPSIRRSPTFGRSAWKSTSTDSFRSLCCR